MYLPDILKDDSHGASLKNIVAYCCAKIASDFQLSVKDLSVVVQAALKKMVKDKHVFQRFKDDGSIYYYLK